MKIEGGERENLSVSMSLFDVPPYCRQAMLKDNLLGCLHQLFKLQVRNPLFLQLLNNWLQNDRG